MLSKNIYTRAAGSDDRAPEAASTIGVGTRVAGLFVYRERNHAENWS